MIRIIDTYSQIGSLFSNGMFDREKWEPYIDSVYAGCAGIFLDDLNECLSSGYYSYEKDILPIINAVHGHAALETLHDAFCHVTERLNEKIRSCFGRELDVDIVLYLGLCNAAGWVTSINGRDVILLGIEKILELNWQDTDSMYGLIYHELGHVYHKQHGLLEQESDDSSRNFVWQLFTEGVAMYFEQALVRDFRYFHQDKDGWLEWCERHFSQILSDFSADLPEMTRTNQRYFGDWVSYCGRGDVGYYLGARFVQYLCKKYDFHHLLTLTVNTVYQEYLTFSV